MTEKEQKDIARRIAKLLSLAIDQAGTPEGDLAQQRADDLRQRYGIEAADDPEDWVLMRVGIPRRNWARVLAVAAGKVSGVGVIPSRGEREVFVGARRCDFEVWEYLANSLIAQANAAYRAFKRQRDKLMSGDESVLDGMDSRARAARRIDFVTSSANDFKSSFAWAVMGKADKLTEDKGPGSPGLVVLRDHEKGIQRILDTLGAKKGSRTQKFNRSATGREGGRNASFAAGLTEGRGPRLLGA